MNVVDGGVDDDDDDDDDDDASDGCWWSSDACTAPVTRLLFCLSSLSWLAAALSACFRCFQVHPRSVKATNISNPSVFNRSSCLACPCFDTVTRFWTEGVRAR